MDFYNRQSELKFLESKFHSNHSELLVFWGRRRVGKTFLLREFCMRKNGIFLLATTSTSKNNLTEFSHTLATYYADERLKLAPLQSWDDFFLYIQEKTTQRTVVVIDEYSYLVLSEPSISTVFQKYWDLHLGQNPNVCLIISGSAISMMEKETLEYRAPLYGRRTGQWLLEPFDILASNSFFQFDNLVPLLEAYCVTGGTPYYNQLLGRHENLFTAIEEKILNKGEVLYQEVDFLLRQEFTSPKSYFPILKAIALGAHKFGEISSKTGFDKSNLVKYLSTLEKLLLIRRDTPITEIHPEKSRKGLYFIHDNFINFWFTFVFPNLTYLEAYETERVMNDFVRPHFNYYVSRTVEPLIIQLLKNDYFQIDVEFEKIGRYWDANREIDFLGETTTGQTMIGEIKWSDSPCSKRVYDHLIQKMTTVENPVYMIVSKSGFNKDILRLKKDNLILIDLDTVINSQ